MREPEVLTVLILKFRAKRDIGGLCALSLADSLSGVPSHRTPVVVPFLELPGASVSWPDIASARVPVLTSNHIGLRLDGEYRTTYSGH
jgi:hypothetical protein